MLIHAIIRTNGGSFMDKFIILGHENPDNDSIVSGYLLEKLMKRKGYSAEFIIPDKVISDENIMLANYCGLDPTIYQKSLPENPNIKYILVDHYERELPGEIVAIIDHHPTDKTITVPYYQNKPACSTSCLIVKDNERYFSVNDLKATCLSAMVDTAAFHSNKTVISDYLWVKSICTKFNFNYDELLTISMCPTDISDIQSASLNGLKKHDLHGHKVASSFLHLSKPTDNETKINQIINYLRDFSNKEGYELFAFIVHDITNFKTTLYKIRENSTEKVEYDEYTSRGTRIIPDITEELKTFQKKKASSN